MKFTAALFVENLTLVVIANNSARHVWSSLAAPPGGLIDTANAPIFGVDANMNVTEWNRKAAEITGFSRHEVIGRSLVQQFITPDYQV